MSLYGRYLKERSNTDIIEFDYGFASYKYLPSGYVYILDMYVLPENRRSKYAYKLADMICEMAIEKGYNHLLVSADNRKNGYEVSIKVFEGYGMKEHVCDGHITYYTKYLKEG